jgi:FkbM family methyltransferase
MLEKGISAYNQLMLKSAFVQLYTWIFARPWLYRFNRHLFKLTLRGLGVLNSETSWSTGEPWFMKQVQSRFSPKTVFDVGANDTAYGVDIFSTAKIYAFEPNPKSFKRLVASAPARVIPVAAAVGAEDAIVQLYDFANSAPLKHTQPTSQLSSVHKSVMIELYQQPVQSFRVKQVTIDSYAKKQHIEQIDLLKIDAEGHELAVLLGAQHLIKAGNVKLIQFEFNQMAAISGESMYQIRQALPGYALFRLLPSGLIPLEHYQPITEELCAFQNVIAMHKDVQW